MSEDVENTITLTRTIDAPAEVVFAAWTDPALLEQWQAEHVEFEAFEGGAFRFETADEDNPSTPHVVNGRVEAFEQDRKLVERWRYGQDGDIEDSLLTVTFRPLEDERTEITLVEAADSHAEAESRIFSIEAWSAAIDELAELIE